SPLEPVGFLFREVIAGLRDAEAETALRIGSHRRRQRWRWAAMEGQGVAGVEDLRSGDGLAVGTVDPAAALDAVPVLVCRRWRRLLLAGRGFRLWTVLRPLPGCNRWGGLHPRAGDEDHGQQHGRSHGGYFRQEYGSGHSCRQFSDF